jgi:hypothetical protein
MALLELGNWCYETMDGRTTKLFIGTKTEREREENMNFSN